jgi:hypothetical protein
MDRRFGKPLLKNTLFCWQKSPIPDAVLVAQLFDACQVGVGGFGGSLG